MARDSATAQPLAQRLQRVLEQEPDVLVAYLFGSHGRGTARKGSDVDVAVLLEAGADVPRRQLELMEKVTRTVAPARADVLVLNDAPIAVGYRVLRDGVLLFCRDEKARVAHFVHTVDRYLDMAPMRRTIEEGQRRRLEEGRFGRS